LQRPINVRIFVIQTTRKTDDMKTSKILIGGAALREMGNDRYTDDTDYLVCDSSKDTFSHDSENNVDYINAASNKFFAEIFKIEEGNKIASAQSLFELKAYAFVQHCQNFNFKKADSCEYDIKFLVREHGIKGSAIAKKHITSGEYSEIEKIINSVKI
jgi:hypothetical protein